MIHLNRYEDASNHKIDDQILADAMRLLLKDKEAAFQIAKETGHAYPENPIGLRPNDFAIPQIVAALEYLDA
jgi:hypothetical protein